MDSKVVNPGSGTYLVHTGARLRPGHHRGAVLHPQVALQERLGSERRAADVAEVRLGRRGPAQGCVVLTSVGEGLARRA